MKMILANWDNYDVLMGQSTDGEAMYVPISLGELRRGILVELLKVSCIKEQKLVNGADQAKMKELCLVRAIH
jgi:hypothetical protein